jgi:hypothetical protein
MANRHGRITLQEKLCEGTPDNLAAPDDYCVRSTDVNGVALKQFDDADGSARRKRLLSQREATYIHWMKPVNIFSRINRLDDAPLVNSARQRQLHKDSINVVARIKTPD